MGSRSFYLVLTLSGLFIFATGLQSCSSEKKIYFLTGASFAVPENGWFEMACEELAVTPINRSVGGESIFHTAIKMYNGTLYSRKELKEIDLFIIMQVHNQDVANTERLKTDYTHYTPAELVSDYAVAYDYVIKKYIADCKKQKKEPKIVLCTHWHDSRTIYNTSIRMLSDRWNLPLIKWDENIGFSRNNPLPGGIQPSLRFSDDTEMIDGAVYGWHPKRGQEEFIQKKMAEIFIFFSN
jgi:hypothetical protein